MTAIDSTVVVKLVTRHRSSVAGDCVFASLDSVSPTSGTAAGGTELTLIGSLLGTATDVRIDGVSVSFVVDSNTRIRCTTNDHDLGAVDISVVLPSGTLTLPASYTFVASTLSFITASPSHGLASGTTDVSIVGTGFHGVVDVEIEPAVMSVSFAIVNDSVITLTIDGPALSATPRESLDFRIIRTPSTDEVTGTAAFTFDAIAPTVVGITPTSGTVAGGTHVVIEVDDSTNADAAIVGGDALTGFAIDDATHVSGDTVARFLGIPQLASVTVHNDAGYGFLVDAYTFFIPAPVGISPVSGSTAGGTHVVIEVEDSTNAISAAIDGANLANFAIDDGTHVSGDTFADTAGAKDVTVTYVGGTSDPLVGGYEYIAPYNFGSLDYTLLLFSENYIYGTAAFGGSGGATAGEWPGTASAGTSGSNSITRTATAPTVGATLGGFATIDFNGTTQHLNGAALSTYVTADIESGWILLYIDSINAGSNFGGGGEWQDVQVVGNASGYWGVGLHVTTPQVMAWHYATATYETIATGAWKLVRWRRVSIGSDLEIGVNSGAMQTAASNAIGDLTGILRVGGAGTSSDYHFDGRIAAMGLSKTAFLDGDFDDIRAGLNAKYGISL